MNLKKNLISFFVGIAGLTLFSSAALAIDCKAPQLPGIPDGDTATQSQLDEAQTEINDFAAETRHYLACLKGRAEFATADERAQMERLYQDMAGKLDTATLQMQQAARKFQHRVSAHMAQADAVTQEEQDAIAEMYEQMVGHLETASAKAESAWRDFRNEPEEAE